MSNLETQVPSLNTRLSLVARGIIMDTLFYWIRDEGGRFLVVVRNQVGLGQKAVCGAPRAKEAFTALQGVRPDRRDEVRWLSLVAEADGAEELAKLLMSELPVDYRHMSVGLLMAMAKARGMQEMTGAPAVTPEEDEALEEAIRTAAVQEGDSAYKAATVDTVARGVQLHQGDLGGVGRPGVPDAHDASAGRQGEADAGRDRRDLLATLRRRQLLVASVELRTLALRLGSWAMNERRTSGLVRRKIR